MDKWERVIAGRGKWVAITDSTFTQSGAWTPSSYQLIWQVIRLNWWPNAIACISITHRTQRPSSTSATSNYPTRAGQSGMARPISAFCHIVYSQATAIGVNSALSNAHCVLATGIYQHGAITNFCSLNTHLPGRSVNSKPQQDHPHTVPLPWYHQCSCRLKCLELHPRHRVGH